MPERETIFSSRMKYDGIFSFQDFYKFCYDWLKEETQLTTLNEEKYSEKLNGDSKKVEVMWKGNKKITDYFKFEMEVKMLILGLSKVEINQGGVKIKTNKGSAEVTLKSTLIRDYDGKFETSAFKKFLRSIYEKWIIPSIIDEFRGKITQESDEFLSQAKAYLDLEGKK